MNYFSWEGKEEAQQQAIVPSNGVLKPCRDESVDFETTQNIFIEGDNLDALHLLQQTHQNRVKVIYIDPPYNTGNDFVYNDKFGKGVAWLNMMLPRLTLAKELLRDDGIIFISIDDKAGAHLRILGDEIFGNFIGNFVWKRRTGSQMAKHKISQDHEYVMAFHKGGFDKFKGTEKSWERYGNPDNDPRGDWRDTGLSVATTPAQNPARAYDIVDPKTGTVYPTDPNRVWAYTSENMEKLIEDGRILFPEPTLFEPSLRPRLKIFKNELDQFQSLSTLLENIDLNAQATKEIQEIMGAKVFDHPKPLSLLETLIAQVADDDDIILDFFAGSATTAHAVLNLNCQDQVNRQFIMVQAPAPCAENTTAYANGYKNIADISKERIRRAARKLKKEHPHYQGVNQDSRLQGDLGFKVFKVDSIA